MPQAEDFFPLGWLNRQFRRQPYPDMTYNEALSAAASIAFNIGTAESIDVEIDLEQARLRMDIPHPRFDGRSLQPVAGLNELWRG